MIPFYGQTGCDVYKLSTESGYQNVYWGETGKGNVKISVHARKENEPDYAYFTLNKVSINEAVTDGNSNYNMAGIKYGVYSDDACSKPVYSSVYYKEGSTRPENKEINTLVTSYDGKVYMDDRGNNVVFVSSAAKASYNNTGRSLYIFRFYRKFNENDDKKSNLYSGGTGKYPYSKDQWKLVLV